MMHKKIQEDNNQTQGQNQAQPIQKKKQKAPEKKMEQAHDTSSSIAQGGAAPAANDEAGGYVPPVTKQGQLGAVETKQGKKTAIQAKQRPVDRSEERAAKYETALVQRKVEEEEATIRARQKTAQYEVRIDKPNSSVYIAKIDTAQPNDSPWVYAITYYPDINPLDGLRRIYRFNSPFNDRMLSEYGLKPAFSVNMKTFEEYWLKHKTSLYTGQGYDWNIDPGQRVLIDMHVVTAERIKELDKKKKKPEDDRYRDANEWEIWLRKNIDINAWKDLLDMAYDDAVQINLPPAGKDPDGEPKKIIYPLDAVNPDRAKEEKQEGTYYGEDIYKLETEGRHYEHIIRFNFIYDIGGSYTFTQSSVKGFYFNSDEALEESEAKYLYYPVTKKVSNYKTEHYLYRVKKELAGKISRSQIMAPINLYKKRD